ncbi:MAG: response regulator transcription factor [Corynebacterium sp.]|uniref:response regulator n=1 Tax=unclassified Corynebacterium TaxID=2624378 RepID=UPI00066BA85A|nr:MULTISPECIES: response regulator transcription factor [unclassified Corynebacterium]MBS5997082.1 response regulator transcription factor [Corynebacterium sp.]MDU1461327.1 response regulator transcription factor [Corynebacterium sp.]MDU5017683.1 response regulator transcription factor [Corynebacterium sp.]MDU7102106.1 response regulator transcription factor [Corynebacterium sp.]
MMADALRVVLVDDEALVRSGLRLLLSNAPDIEVVAEASNGRDAVATVLDTQPDVVLMDIRMPVMDGIAAVEKILSVQTVPIIMLTAFDTDSFILRALRAGAAGFLLKSTPPESLMAAVRAAAAGQPLLSPEVVDKLVGMQSPALSDVHSHHARTARNHLGRLSSREREIAELVAQGLNNQDIADQLVVSMATVKSHMQHILKKIGGTSRVHIAIMVLEARG